MRQMVDIGAGGCFCAKLLQSYRWEHLSSVAFGAESTLRVLGRSASLQSRGDY